MNNLLSYSKMFVKKNASTILTVVGSAGVVATAVLAVKATPKAMRVLEEAKEEKQEDLTVLEKVQIAGPAYIPAIVTGVATVACIFGANILNQRQQAALMSAYALLDNSYKEYRAKVMELYGEDADANVKAEVAKDKYQKQCVVVSEGKHLYYDSYSERYFEATPEQIMKAEYAVNKKLQFNDCLFLNDFYELVGLEPTDYGNYLGWSLTELIECTWFSWWELSRQKVFLEDDLECTILNFSLDPNFDFENY